MEWPPQGILSLMPPQLALEKQGAKHALLMSSSGEGMECLLQSFLQASLLCDPEESTCAGTRRSKAPTSVLSNLGTPGLTALRSEAQAVAP